MEKDLLCRCHTTSCFSGKVSNMAEVNPSTSYLVRALEVQAIARVIMSYNPDQDLIERVTVLQEYLDLAMTHPDHDYGAVIRKVSAELLAVIRSALKFDLMAEGIEQKRMALFETAIEYSAQQELLLVD